MQFSELIRRITAADGGEGARAQIRLAGDPTIRGIREDSRKVQPGDLFMARSGTKTSGAKFAADAVSKGAVAVVSDEPIGLPDNIAFAQVADGNRAAALLGHAFANYPTQNMKLIAVTGTKGKTTVAYLMRSVLKAAGFKVGMIGTVEIDDGKTITPAEMTTPGSVELVEMFSRMQANGVTHCVMEVSSHALHQQRTSGLDFAVAIFTNLTGDHLDYHKTMEEYAAAKATLFQGLSAQAVAIINADDAWAEKITQGCKGRVVKYRVKQGLVDEPWKRLAANDEWHCVVHFVSPRGMSIYVSRPRRVGPVHIVTGTMIGRHNAANMLCVFAAACEMGVKPVKVFRALKRAAPPPGRLQRVEPEVGTWDYAVFVDYAHTHDALENVLTALRTTMRSESAEANIRDKRLICVFGCGGDRDRTKRPKMAAIAERLADVVIVTSDNPRTEAPGAIIEEICAGFSAGWKTAGKIVVEPDRRAAIQKAITLAETGDVVVLAGKGHENYQIIGTTKHHFDDVEEAVAAMKALRNDLKTGNSMANEIGIAVFPANGATRSLPYGRGSDLR